uniref:Protein disulfide-isomerase a5 n=1 Tax=Triatoma infestans TaxID=30076 RepID=A0A170Z0H2_TRIIF
MMEDTPKMVSSMYDRKETATSIVKFCERSKHSLEAR